MNKKFCDLSTKVIIVTGAAQGIGLSCATELAAAGARVVLTDIDADACNEAATALKSEGYTVSSLTQDVAVEADWQRVVNATVEEYSGLDVLVNNAGIYIGGLLVRNSIEELQRLNKINVESIFPGMKAASEVMQPEGIGGKGGSIINLSSVAGLVGVPGHSAYGSTKGSVRLYTKHAAVEFARLGYGIRVNSIHPGVIDTAMGQQVLDDFVEIGLATNNEEAREQVLQLIPLASFGKAQDVAYMVHYLASDESAYCTGAEFIVDGGIAAG